MNTIKKLFLVVKVIKNFHIAILDRLGIIHGTVLYKLRDPKIELYARAGTEDIAEIAVIASGSEYNLDLIKLSKSPTILDLGGHIGAFSIPVATKLNNVCTIHTFEPQKDNYKLLLRNIKQNKAISIHPQNIAISNRNGKGFLHSITKNTDAYYLEKKSKKKPNCVVKTLPDSLKNYKISTIDIVKIDIEGGEYQLFQHLDTMEFLRNHAKYIFMEFHNIDEDQNYSVIEKATKGSFRVIEKTSNTVVLKNAKQNKKK